jgi:hypothetical protein
MKTIEIKKEKRTYNSPKIDRIRLDNEISLALESAPPSDEGQNITPEYFNNDPFKSNLG